MSTKAGEFQTTHVGPVLLVTFNRALVAYLRRWEPAGLSNVTFENYHTFARGYLNARGVMDHDSICSGSERAAYIAQAVDNVRKRDNGKARALFERPLRFFVEEIQFIDLYGFSEEQYVSSDRFGRGGPFARELRPALLAVRDEYRAVRAEGGHRYDWDDLAGETVEQLARDASQRRYRHIVIDEGQDFSPAMLRSLAAAIPPDGSLTFFGDMAQQIYGRQVSWKQAGLSVPNGTWKFERNYRNTPEIAALGLAIADMPYFSDVPDMVRPDKFEPSGPKPSLIRCSSYKDEAKFVIEAATEAARTSSVGVLMRRREDEGRFRNAFGASAQHLYANMKTWRPGPGISWGTAHAAKGYEFDIVFLVGLADGAWPEPVAVANEGQEAATANDGRLLYVGVTRARRELNMTYVGAPTQLLPENHDLWQDQSL